LVHASKLSNKTITNRVWNFMRLSGQHSVAQYQTTLSIRFINTAPEHSRRLSMQSLPGSHHRTLPAPIPDAEHATILPIGRDGI
jgi:hypothetical protein